MVALTLHGVSEVIHPKVRESLLGYRDQILAEETKDCRVVVFGGGTGLSNIIGGDSRRDDWCDAPFGGLKKIFPQTQSVVCVTDNGGSTGELLKDLPLIALGDLRHVLLSSVQLANLQKVYTLERADAEQTIVVLSALFNWRYKGALKDNAPALQKLKQLLTQIPESLAAYLLNLLDSLFEDRRLSRTLLRGHCLGNLLLAAAIYRKIDPSIDNFQLARGGGNLHEAISSGLRELAGKMAAADSAVIPSSSTPAQLRILYSNGVEMHGEHTFAFLNRGCPVESVAVDFASEARVYDDVLEDIGRADILILAPGSLYSSLIPVFKSPGFAEAVRNNSHALKVLISNLWVQTGETDLSLSDPERKFHVSDMIRAYEKNIPGGTRGLFNEVLCVSLQDIPASILQNYAVEGKVPIYLDREAISRQNYFPVECDIYSQSAIAERGVIQHDPDRLAMAIKGLYCSRDCLPSHTVSTDNSVQSYKPGEYKSGICLVPCLRFQHICDKLDKTRIIFTGGSGDNPIDLDPLRQKIEEILWKHLVIPISHFDYFDTIHCIDKANWGRDQRWDNVFSFYEPRERSIKIRADQIVAPGKLEIGLMIALGESLLGDYVAKKRVEDVYHQDLLLGSVYHLHLQKESSRTCFLTEEQLQHYLRLTRMCKTNDKTHYTRLINRGEGFTPPGLLMGLMYAWYVDNRLASNIDYKMSVMKIHHSNLIPEQMKMVARRRELVAFLKNIIFRSFS